ncbi:MAG: acetyltransferase [Opitutia bacterium]|jgi:sugar O-acyltransferase (sialic acid O-acetyltransferase NeuD family)
MKRLLIVGAGGFGREVFHWVRQHPDHGKLWQIAGFLDDKGTALEAYDYSPGIVGTIKDYRATPGDLLVVGLALPKVKKAVVDHLLSRGAEFLTFVHPSVVLGGNVKMGRGTFVCPGAVITSDVSLGDFVTFNCCSTMGHDAVLENYVTLSGHCDITGFCRVEEGAFFGSHACMIPRTKVGAWSVVGAGSTVIMNVPPGVTVLGSPARKIAT